MFTVHGSYTAIQIPSHFTQFLTQNDQISTWKSLHLSYNIVYSQICHKYIHIMGWKDQISREIATWQNFASPRICCEQAAAGMLRPFPAHFVLLQSNSTHCNMQGSHAAAESYEMWHFMWNRLLGILLWIFFKFLLHLSSMSNVYGSHTVALDYFTFHTLSQIKSSKFHQKITAHEWQHCLQSNLSQIHSHHRVKRPNKQRNIKLSSNRTHSNVYDSHAATENCMKCDIWSNTSQILSSILVA